METCVVVIVHRNKYLIKSTIPKTCLLLATMKLLNVSEVCRLGYRHGE